MDFRDSEALGVAAQPWRYGNHQRGGRKGGRRLDGDQLLTIKEI